MEQTRRAEVEGLTIAASVSGPRDGWPLLLLHGWPQCRLLWDRVAAELADEFFVVALDLPAIGDSRGAPPDGTKTTLAHLVLSAAERLGATGPIVAGMDVGGMIAFAAARDFSARIRGALIMNTVLPGLHPWDEVLADPRIWHFAFHQIPALPELLVSGHQGPYFDFFHDALAADPARISPRLRDVFAAAYSRPEALSAGFDWYRAMPADARHNRAGGRITTPLLYARGDADPRPIDGYLAGLRAAGATALESAVIPRCGELAALEAPEALCETIRRFAQKLGSARGVAGVEAT